MTYKAFISYKHGKSTEFARNLELALKNYAKPLFARPIKIFRDENHLVPGSDLGKLIVQALEQSSYFILLASPSAANSEWVKDEIEKWCDKKSRIDNLIIILTDGNIEINSLDKTIDWNNTNALPLNLKQYLPNVPLFIDLRWAESIENQSLQNPDFKKEINRISAKLNNKDPNELMGIEIIEHRRTIRIRRITIWVLSFLLLVSGVLGVTAYLGGEAAKKSRTLSLENLQTSILEQSNRAWDNRQTLQADHYISQAVALGKNREAQELYLEVMSRGVEYVRKLPNSNSKLAPVIMNDSTILALSRDGRIRTYSIDSLVQQNEFEYPINKIMSMGVDVRTGKIGIGGRGGEIGYGSLDNLDLLIPNAHVGSILEIALTSEPHQIISVGSDNTIKIWNVKTRSPEFQFKIPLPGIKTAKVLNENKIIVGDKEGFLRLYNSKTGILINQKKVSNLEIEAISARKNNSLFAVITLDESFREARGRGHRAILWNPLSDSLIKLPTNLTFEAIAGLSFTQNGDTLIIPDKEKRFFIYEIDEHGNFLKLHEKKHDLKGGLCFTNDGKYIISSNEGIKKRLISSWNVVAEAKGHSSGIWYSESSPTGNYFVTSDGDKKLILWHATTGDQVWKITLPEIGHTLDYSFDGKSILVDMKGNSTLVVDALSGEIRNVIYTENNYTSTRKTSYNPTKDEIAILQNEHTIRFINSYGNETRGPLNISDSVNTIMFRQDGNSLFFITDKVRLNEIGKNNVIKSYAPIMNESYSSDIASSDDGKIVAVNTKGIIYVWSTDKIGSTKYTKNLDCTAIEFSPDRSRIMASCYGYFEEWDVNENLTLNKLQFSEGNLGWMGKPTYLMSGNKVILPDEEGNVSLWNLGYGGYVKSIFFSDRNHSTYNFSPQEEFLPNQNLAISGRDNKVRIYDINTTNLVAISANLGSTIIEIKYDSNSQKLLVTTENGLVFESNIDTYEFQIKLVANPKSVSEMTIIGKNRFAVAYDYIDSTKTPYITTGHIQVFEGKIPGTNFKAHEHKITNLNYLQDLGVLLSCSNRKIKIWDDSFKLIRTIDDFLGTVIHTKLSPDNSLLFVVARDGVLRVYDTNSWRLLKSMTLSNSTNPYLEQIDISPNNQFAAVATYGGSCKIICLKNWKTILDLHGHEDAWMRTSKFSPDGKWLVTASSDNWLRIWDFQKINALIEGRNSDLLKDSKERTLIPLNTSVQDLLTEIERDNSIFSLVLKSFED
ncbi:TIR domain-containing protein [Maribacter algarum]|uniref:TIR domain-containing protein n=1 Tax=Maribacter algarum (ex Zhang et al. 2020) TaxID=2578118 RepID=A0A5S3PWD3_9FLAO|nr:TIR domain-containing protein [Maribacter algarum]TMM59336.1 TIR domain-containing protein [Maribacter algarum]